MNLVGSRMELGVVECALALGAVIIALYYATSSRFDYWRCRGIAGPRPVPLLGNFAAFVFGRTSSTEVYARLYKEWRRQPYFGIYNGRKPQLVINDLDLVKSILVRDFHVFNGRGIRINVDADPLGAHLFNLTGPRWKYLRSKLSPIFTSGKLRHMFDLMLECAEHFESYLHGEVEKSNVVECREVAAKFTTDVIGSCAFGIKMNALDSEDSEFRKYGREIFTFGYLRFLKIFLREIAPKIYRLFRVQVISTEITNFFISSVRETMELRKRENFARNDLIDILMEIKNNHDSADFELTDSLLAAQAFVFFIAGFETSSSTISFALLELAHQPEVQETVRLEILDKLEKHGGKVTYEVIKEMTYLEMVVQETLRKNPPIPVLVRQASQSYPIADTGVTLEKGTYVSIPIYAIHRDPEYYPDPDVFDPQRFTDEARHLRHPMTHLPFGDGPKVCIGARFAALQVKLGLIKVLKNYRVKPTEMSPLPYEIRKTPFILAPKSGVSLEFEALQISK